MARLSTIRPIRLRLIICSITVTVNGLYPTFASADSTDAPAANVGAYFDVGYIASSTQPANGEWRTKSTTTSLDQLSLNNLAAYATREATRVSRWGWQFGLQAGRDVDDLVTDEANSSAETVKHLYYSHLEWVAPVGQGLHLTGGLIPGHLGYESFWAFPNPNYTRGYYADLVPYFHWGLIANYPYGGEVNATVLIVNGYDYLASPNNLPSYQLQLNWTPRNVSVTGSLYYGPEQSETASEYWRSVGEIIAEWTPGHFVVVADLGYGSEKQAALQGEPDWEWGWACGWLQWQATTHWRGALRTGLYLDEDGAITGREQSLVAVTATLEYRAVPVLESLLSARLEYRYDHSWGPGGGYYTGPNNELQPHKHVLLLALLLNLDTGP